MTTRSSSEPQAYDKASYSGGEFLCKSVLCNWQWISVPKGPGSKVKSRIFLEEACNGGYTYGRLLEGSEDLCDRRSENQWGDISAAVCNVQS
jgi:hypothetical protein